MILVVGNWKMNPNSPKKAKEIFEKIESKVKNLKSEIVICPPFLYLPILKPKIKNLKLGAQNIFWEEKGAFTGEISAKMIKSFGAKYVILGHVERKKYFSEKIWMIKKKMETAQKENLKPIICIGEMKKIKDPKKILKKEVIALIEKTKKLPIFAYEPCWAVGSKRPCPPKRAKEILDFLKKFLKTKILYGGSVNPKIAKDYIKAGFDGLLVGSLSLNPDQFSKIIKSCL
jgi:triosephosphate isomerase